MEIYKAAQETHDLKNWNVYKLGDNDYLVKRTLTKYQHDYYNSNSDYNDYSIHELMTITKQRGGTRFFKTADAALNAINQIGQLSAHVYF